MIGSLLKNRSYSGSYHHVVKTSPRVKDPMRHLNGKTVQKPTPSSHLLTNFIFYNGPAIYTIMLLRRSHGAKPLWAILTVKQFKNLSHNNKFSSTINLTKILVSEPYSEIDIFDKWFSFFIFLQI